MLCPPTPNRIPSTLLIHSNVREYIFQPMLILQKRDSVSQIKENIMKIL